MKLLQWARRNGEVVHISQVERGAACQCVCDECGLPLIARQGPKNTHSFAHTDSDCQGNQETLLHLKAKEIIAGSKRLTVTGRKGNEEVVFDSVKIEQTVGPYRIDAIGVKNGRRCLIEIAVTHRCSSDKVLYFKENKLAVVEIAIDPRREFGSMEDFTEYVIAGAARRWISNSKLNRMPEVSAVPVDTERVRELLDGRDRLEPVFLGQLRKAAEQRLNQEHYGALVEADVRGFGLPYQRFLCVKSEDLPNEYGNFAMVMWHHKQMRKYLGRRVRFDIIYDYEQSIYWETGSLFPRIVIRAVEGVGRTDLYDEIGSRRWIDKRYPWI